MKTVKTMIEHFQALSSSKEQVEELEILKKEIFNVGRVDHSKDNVGEAFGYNSGEMKEVYDKFIESCKRKGMVNPSRVLENLPREASSLKEIILIAFHIGYFIR